MQDLESLYEETFYHDADRLHESTEIKYLRSMENHIRTLESSLLRVLPKREANIWHTEMKFIKSGLQELLQMHQRKNQS